MQFGTDKEHTTGPLQVWSETKLDDHYEPTDTGWPFVVCKPSDAIGTSDYHTAIGIQSKADAYLYAAAPALLAAFIALWDAYGRNMERHGMNGDGTWTDEDHGDWQETSSAANAIMKTIKGI